MKNLFRLYDPKSKSFVLWEKGRPKHWEDKSLCKEDRKTFNLWLNRDGTTVHFINKCKDSTEILRYTIRRGPDHWKGVSV
jgi:hypothetical protein